jgi:hypothetical protein
MLSAELERLKPDCVLIEGPPDADAMLAFAGDAEMKPPVALLIYAVEDAKKAAFYPFAEFSPEWQAIRYGLKADVPVRFMDLPQRHQLALEIEEEKKAADEAAAAEQETAEGTSELENAGAGELPKEVDVSNPENEELLHHDPLTWLARAANLSDGEEWWERMVEERSDAADVFPAIREAMTVLRSEAPRRNDERDALREARREAWMRETMRAAQKEGFQRIAVICGAWHVPALAEWPPASKDRELLTKLPKVAVEATWAPWTYGRLAYSSGYGAGVVSPGYYEYLWQRGQSETVGPAAAAWLVKVARLLREEDIDCSSAHVIESVRLAESLAAFRERSTPGLTELNEAVRTVICMGDETPLQLIHNKLIVGERMGSIPEGTPAVPLARDLAAEQKRLRFKPEAVHKVLDLDLRKPGDLERSHLLHRLTLLSIPWGAIGGKGMGKGTFHEIWNLQWQPEFAVRLVEASVWGNTVEGAASARAVDRAEKTESLGDVAGIAEAVLLANLPQAVTGVVQRLEALAATSGAVGQLMDAVPPLASIARYGSVRQMDASQIRHLLDGMVERISIGLPGACSSLDDDAAAAMHTRLLAVHQAVKLMESDDHTASWERALFHLADMQGLHGLIAGAAARRLLDDEAEPADASLQRLGFALSPGSEPQDAAAWLQGFLHGSGIVLLHDDRLWSALDAWLAGLTEDAFTRILPLLRRTFGGFPSGERRQIGERAKQPGSRDGSAAVKLSGEFEWNQARADKLVPVLQLILKS